MRSTAVACLVAAALAVACGRDAEAPTATRAPESARPELSMAVKQQFKANLEHFSTVPMLRMAERLGITEIQGKAIAPRQRHRHDRHKNRLNDVPVMAEPNPVTENEPTVATNPVRKNKLVAGSHYEIVNASTNTFIFRCEARHSSDGGKTWSAAVLMPQLTGESECSDPVLAYSADGSRAFYAYMDLKFSPTFDWDIVVSYSTDDGATWNGPFVALNSVGDQLLYDKPWIGTAADAPNYVYVTATSFPAATGGCGIAFTRSTNRGTAFDSPQILEESLNSCGGDGSNPVVQGSRPAGGRKGKVLVAWYNSGPDANETGLFRIRTRYSGDFGATFEPVVSAATDVSEVPGGLGPFFCYERWTPAMFPDVEIDAAGRAHIAYTHDPDPDLASPEDGDIRYVSSSGPPYSRWSRPVTINDDRTVSAQGFVALDVKSGMPRAVWVDHRLPPQIVFEPQCDRTSDLENQEYAIFASTLAGNHWSRNVQVSDQSSMSDFFFIGDYVDLSNGFAIWTDRRVKTDIFDLGDNVWGSRTRH